MRDPITVTLNFTGLDTESLERQVAALGDAARQRREHDNRVSELIEANNRAVEKRRAACALLRKAQGELAASAFELESSAPFMSEQSGPDMLRAAAANQRLASHIETFLLEIHA